MSIWNKVLAGLVLVSSLVFFYLALRALKTHQHWRDLLAKHQSSLEAALEEQQKLLRGTPDGTTLGVRQVQAQIHRLNVARGRVWANTQPQRVDQATGEATVMPPAEAVYYKPEDKPENTQLSIFVQPGPQTPPAYLGEFQIVGTANGHKVWQIRPTRTLSPRELGRLQQASRALWIMYEKIPSFTPEMLAGMEQAPAAGAGGEKAALPRMVDYRQIFDDYFVERSKLHDLIESAKNDLKGLKSGEMAGDLEIKQLESEVAKYKTSLAEAQRQRDAVAAHLQLVDAKRTEFQAKVDATIQENQATARKIAEAQFEAARRIEERTRRAVSAAGP